MLLQKIIVVIVGLVMSVVGALSPDLFAGKNEGESLGSLAANTAEETLATLRTSDGEAFARVSVLWIEVDGRRVTEDAWGTGEVDEIRFKVGVKDVDGVAIAVGDKIVTLHPTDIITIRMFRGDFSYRGMGSTAGTVQLQGSVKTTVLNEGDLSNRVLTRVGELDLDKDTDPGEESKVAYVVLTTGEKVDTVAVEDGGSRIFTEEVTNVADAKDEPGNLLAKWVKIDGKLVREYTWGDGSLPKVEFEPAEGASRSIVLAFNGETFEVPANERIVVEDFVGEYLVYQVSGGMMRLRLDGYARAYLTAPAVPLPSQGGIGAPLASFDYAPPSPKTTDTVQFRDRSTDDGIIVFRQWDFGDNVSSVLMDPTHRFEHPGTYEVTLTVTDNDLKSSNITRTIIVRNSEPVSDFDYSPKIVSTDTVVAFTDHSYDPDGTLSNWTWDFGDGGRAYTRHPTHRFTLSGDVTVTLTVTDELGGSSALSKVINVRNSPPLAAFTFTPSDPSTLVPVQFLDNSTDKDGQIVAWNWSFGDGKFGSGSAPVHAFARPGLYIVSLTAYDDMGDADTASTTILVGNRPPFADFTWTPEGAPAGAPVTFSSQSSDPDGIILSMRWNFGDGTAETMGSIVSHSFPSAGSYQVTLTVTDNTLAVSSVTRSVEIANSAPRANMIFAPNPTFRDVEVTFSDTSTDPDGDDIVSSTWDFGDNTSAETGRLVRHTYSGVGTYNVKLTIVDENGQNATISRPLRVVNRAPTISPSYAPRPVRAGEDVTFTGLGSDLDSPGPIAFFWNFSDGVQLTGQAVNRSFQTRGDYHVAVRGVDVEGAVSATVVLAFRVEFALPDANFTWDPAVPTRSVLTNFTDTSFSVNGPLREWEWSFGDNTGVQTTTNPSHVYDTNGTFTVRLKVTDIAGQSSVIEKDILVNLAPRISFISPSDVVPLQTPILFTDTSDDLDGTVDNWSWTFGDGSTSFARHPTHPGYQDPGSYEVWLTIRDNHGATNTTRHFVNIANTPPVATWTRIPGGDLTVGQPATFDGTSSSDPDGNAIVSWSWTMGDLATRTGDIISHTYTRSGHYTVGLKVFDGSAESPRTPDSHKQVTVRPDHPVTIVVGAKLPDGGPAAISLPPYAVGVRIGTAPISVGSYLPVGDLVEATLDPAFWVAGDIASVRITAPFLTGPHEQSFTLSDDHTVVFVNFTLRMAVTAKVIPAPGDSIAPLAFLGGETSYGGDPLYTDITERPHGGGLVMYADGTPAGSQRVDIETRWVPLRAVSQYRNATASPETGSLLPNWCKVTSVTSALNGTFNWDFDGESPCYLNSVAGGVYPLGRWEVRARPQVATAENRVSDMRPFYVDPTGGLLLRATLGLA